MKRIIDIPEQGFNACRSWVEIGVATWQDTFIANSIPYEEGAQAEWIPVSERLPDKNMACLVSVGKLNFIQIAMYSDLMETIDHKIFYQGDYGKNNFQNITEYVNAWQPLPKPYKEGSAE